MKQQGYKSVFRQGVSAHGKPPTTPYRRDEVALSTTASKISTFGQVVSIYVYNNENVNYVACDTRPLFEDSCTRLLTTYMCDYYRNCFQLSSSYA